jgi:beta-lactamase class A
MKQVYGIALLITSDDGQSLFDSRADKLWESASTIKVPLLLLAIQEMARRNDGLGQTLQRLAHHNTRGSGILNWTNADNFSFKDLIYTTVVYSDCLASNILLDYIGGQARLNGWLKNNGFSTRLRMPYLIFNGENGPMPHVGDTSAKEMLSIYSMLDQQACAEDIKSLLRHSTGSINKSWLEKSLPGPLEDLRHKTGSMINCGPKGETIYNAVGSFNEGGAKRYFCLLSRGKLGGKGTVLQEAMGSHVATYFYDAAVRTGHA